MSTPRNKKTKIAVDRKNGDDRADVNFSRSTTTSKRRRSEWVVERETTHDLPIPYSSPSRISFSIYISSALSTAATMNGIFRQTHLRSACHGRPFRRAILCQSLAALSNDASSQKLEQVTADDLQRQCQEVLDEASALTRSLYRLCMRSVKLIRQGNHVDAADFKAREEKQLEDMFQVSKDERLSGIISMLPPVEPEAELHARSEYYAQYTSENFFAESDCLAAVAKPEEDDVLGVPEPSQFARYFYHLRKGEEHRQWLLQDMKFADPFTFDLERVQRLEDRVRDLTQAHADYQWQHLEPEQRREMEQAQLEYDTYDSDQEAFSDDEDDDETPTIRYRNRRRRLEDEEEDE